MTTVRGENPAMSRRRPRLAPCAFGVVSIAVTTFGCATQERLAPGSDDVGRVELMGVSDGDIVSGDVELVAKVTGVEALRGVEFYVDDERFDTVLLPPFATVLDTSAFSDGVARIRAVAATEENEAHAAAKDVNLDNTGPTIALWAPTEKKVFYDGGELRLTFGVEDPRGVRSVEVTVSGSTVAVAGPPFTASFALDALGARTEDLPLDLSIVVVATDDGFVQSSATFDLELESRLAWKFSTLGNVWAPPAFGLDGTVYFGSFDDKLYAVGAGGSELWSYDTGADIVASPAVDYSATPATIWVGAGSALHVVDATGVAAGTPFETGSTLGTSPVVVGDTVYFGTFDGRLIAHDTATRATKWTFAAGGAIQSAPVLLDNGLLVFGSDDNWLYALNLDGTEAWRLETGGDVWSTPTLANDGSLLVGSNDGYLYNVTPYGAKAWEFEARGQIWGGATQGPDGTIFVSSTFRRLYGLDNLGDEIWQREASGFAYATPAVSSDGIVYAGATDGTLFATGSDGTPLWSFEASGEITGSPVLSADESLVVFGSNDRHLYVLRTGAGSTATGG